MRHDAITITEHDHPLVDTPIRPAAYWVDRAFPPGYNTATREIFREAGLAPFRYAVRSKLARLRRMVAQATAKPASKESILQQAHRIEGQAQSANAHRLMALSRRLDELLERVPGGSIPRS